MADMNNQNLSFDEEDGVPVCDVCFAPKFISDVMTTIDSCNHKFCGYCLEKWSQQHDTCPVDRQNFTKIVFSNAITGEIIDKQVITPHQNAEEPESETEIDDDINYLEFITAFHSHVHAQQANQDNEDDQNDESYEMDHYDYGDDSEFENEFDDEDEEVMEDQNDLN